MGWEWSFMVHQPLSPTHPISPITPAQRGARRVAGDGPGEGLKDRSPQTSSHRSVNPLSSPPPSAPSDPSVGVDWVRRNDEWKERNEKGTKEGGGEGSRGLMLDSLALPIMNRAKPSEEAEAMERLTMDEPGGKGMTFLSSCTRGGARLFFGAPPHAPPSYRGVSRRRGETATMEGGAHSFVIHSTHRSECRRRWAEWWGWGGPVSGEGRVEGNQEWIMNGGSFRRSESRVVPSPHPFHHRLRRWWKGWGRREPATDDEPLPHGPCLSSLSRNGLCLGRSEPHPLSVASRETPDRYYYIRIQDTR